jgi:hypothetical protein
MSSTLQLEVSTHLNVLRTTFSASPRAQHGSLRTADLSTRKVTMVIVCSVLSELLQLLDQSKRDGLDIGEIRYIYIYTTFKGDSMRGHHLADLGVCERQMLK